MTGYSHEIIAEFSDITLAWMIDQCHGLLAFDPEYVQVETQRRPAMRKEAIIQANPKAIVGWAAGYIHDSFEGVYRFGLSRYRTPGQYTVNDFKKTDLKGDTNEMVHPSVRVRMMKVPSWKPPALEGFEVST